MTSKVIGIARTI